MRVGIYGRKVGMTQIFDEAGLVVPVTVIETSGCAVAQVKTKDKEGYNAVQVGFGARKLQNVNKAKVGHYKKAGVQAKAKLKEIRFPDDQDMSQFKAGEALTPGMFEKGDLIDVIGTSKGHGFTGVMKRFNFHGKHATHGTSKYFRHGGSNGSNTFPGRVLKNKGMPGHHGNTRTTVSNLKVVEVRVEENLILLKGAVPGPKDGFVLLRSSNRLKAPQGRSMTAKKAEATAEATA